MREYESLCNLGLPEQELARDAIEALHRLIGGSMFGFFQVNARWQVQGVYLAEAMPERHARTYFEEFYNRREAEVGPTFTEMLRDRIPAWNFNTFGRRAFNSELYAEFFRPMGMHHSARFSVIDGQNRHGMFIVARARGDRPYAEPELTQLQHAARYFAHGIELARTRALVRGDAVDARDEGFLLLDCQGVVLHGCDLGLRLFHEATRAEGAVPRAGPNREDLPKALVADAQNGGPTKDCVLTSPQGAFVFRPFLMRSPAGGGAPVAVRVKRRGSMALRLWQESERFALSARERQTAVLLGTGEGYDSIAARLGVSRNTAVSYVRRTYEKLGTNQREQMIRVLLS